jgi:DNA-binding IclR family transcriptional regulator
MEEAKSKAAKGVDAVDRALAILRCYEERSAVLTLTEIAERTGLYKSTVLRLAASLENAGFLVRHSDKTYALGAELMRLGSLYVRAFRLEDHVRPVLRNLLEDTGESTSFFRKEGDRRICLFREDSQHGIRDHIREGDVLSLEKGAAGHVLTRFDLPPAGVSRLADLLAQLPETSFGERDAETAAIAAPVFADKGRLAGALSISGPMTRFGPDDVARMTPALLKAARELSERLGGRESWAD